MRSVMRRAVTATTAGALLLGGAVTMAPSASAVGKSACGKKIGNWESLSDITGKQVKFRTGPSTKYTAKGALVRGTGVERKCYAKGTRSWTYVKAVSDAHKGSYGWVASKYIR